MVASFPTRRSSVPVANICGCQAKPRCFSGKEIRRDEESRNPSIKKKETSIRPNQGCWMNLESVYLVVIPPRTRNGIEKIPKRLTSPSK